MPPSATIPGKNCKHSCKGFGPCKKFWRTLAAPCACRVKALSFMKKLSLLFLQILSNSRAPLWVAALTAAAVLAGADAQGAAFVTKVVTASGATWSAAVWSNPPNVAVSAPLAGNTYELIFNGTAWGNNVNDSRLRNPAVAGISQFPGDSLMIDTNTDIRLKTGGTIVNGISPAISYFPGVSGNPGLIMNGGVLNAGDTAIFVVTGRVQIASRAILSGGNNGGGEQILGRSIYLRGILTGSGDAVILQSHPGTAHLVDGDGSGFTGNWIIQCGYLKGLAGINPLGAGNIIVAPTNGAAASNPTNTAIFEPMYDYVTPGSLVLSNNPASGCQAIMILHQNCTFASLTINGTSLPTGVYSYSTLSNTYPLNFIATNGTGSITVQPPAPPPAPASVAAINGDSQVALSWTPAANSGGYNINRSGTHLGPYAQVGTVAGTNFTDTGLVNGSTYYYVIVATNLLGNSPNSPEAIGQPNPLVVNIAAVGGTNQISLTWDALPGVDSYTVRRSATANGTTTDIATGVIGTTYVDTALANGTRYFYRIEAAMTGGGVSGRSAQVNAVTAPSTPASMSAVLFAKDVITVGWTSLDPVGPTFNIETSPDGVNFTPLASTNAIGFTNGPGLAAATHYYYRVQATNSGTGLASSYSAVVSTFTVPADPISGFAGLNINFVNNTTNSSQNKTLAPAAPGYLPDTGIDYGDPSNVTPYGTYGWTTAGGTNISIDSRWRQDPTSPDIRYDNFSQAQKNGLIEAAVWDIQVPNGFYWVHILSGDPQNIDGNFQWNIEGVTTEGYVPAAVPISAHWHDFTNTATVNDGKLTISGGPSSVNNKINFIDIYPATAVGLAVTQDPVGETLFENRVISLSGAVGPIRPLTGAFEGYLPVAYQWYQDSGSGYVAVPNATNATYSVGLAQLSDAGNYKLVITNSAGSVTSQVAAVSVLVDNDPPVLVSAGSLDGTTVGVCFDELLNQSANGTTRDDANYAIVDAEGVVPVAPGGVSVRPDGRSLLLILDLGAAGRGPIHGDFTVSCAADDLKGTAGGQSGAGKVSGLTALDTGITNGPAGSAVTGVVPGSTYTCKDGEFDVLAGGADIWTTSDQGHLTLQSRTGDFDVIVRVQSLTQATAADTIAKAGLMARQTFDSNSPALHILVNPPPPGRNLGEAGQRPTVGAATASWAPGTNYSPTFMPNAWQRLTRAGNVFSAYWSSNGTDWVLFAQTNQTFTDPMLVGMATTAHTAGNGQSLAKYRNFHFVDRPTITGDPVNMTNDPGNGVSFMVTASGPAEGGPLVYQWRRNGVIIPGATNTTLSFDAVQCADTGSYDVRVSNSGGTIFSAAARLVVRETVPPTLTCPGSLTVECTGNGANVSLGVTATDNCDPNPVVNCTPASGSHFALGTTHVSCTAMDANGNTSTACNFDVTVSDTTAPVLTCTNITRECTGGGGANVSFTPTVVEACDPSPTNTCTPPSGSLFAIGTTPVHCTSTDITGNSGSCNFTVTVRDTTVPAFTCPTNQLVECTGGPGTVVTYITPSAVDTCDPSPTVSCSPASGSSFAPGTNTVTCIAYDVSLNTNRCTFQIVVRDTTAPSITCVLGKIVECTGAWTFDPPTASDICGTATVTIVSTVTNRTGHCGNTYDATRTWRATDGAGNTNQCSQTVTVVDTTPPTITCSPNLTNNCTSVNGAVVTFTVTATDACGPNPVPVCTPPSGSTFALGTTPVNCTATDACNNQSSPCSFTVTVKDAAGAPTMTIVQSGANVVISWPATCTTYNLEKATALPNWGPSGAVVVLNGNRYYSTNSNTGTAFYRLNKP